MAISWNTVLSVLIALLVFKVLDKLFIGELVDKIGKYEENNLDAEI